MTISATNQEQRRFTLAKKKKQRECLQKQIKDSSTSGEILDNLLPLQTWDQQSEDGGGLGSSVVVKRCKFFTHLCGGRARLFAWLALNEAVCLPKWILPTPNHSIFPLLSSPLFSSLLYSSLISPASHPCHHQPASASMGLVRWPLLHTALSQKFTFNEGVSFLKKMGNAHLSPHLCVREHKY